MNKSPNRNAVHSEEDFEDISDELYGKTKAEDADDDFEDISIDLFGRDGAADIPDVEGGSEMSGIDPEPESAPESQPNSDPDSKPESGPESQLNTDPDAKPESELIPDPELEIDSDPDVSSIAPPVAATPGPKHIPMFAERQVGDPLLECLSVVTSLFNKARSPESLVAGMPIPKSGLTPELTVWIAKKAGFSARLVKIPFEEISALTLPCVLTLKNRKACVLVGLDEGGEAEAIFPETAPGYSRLKSEDLAKQYDGRAIFVREKYGGIDPLIKKQPQTVRGWFWKEVLKHWHIIVQVLLAGFASNLLMLAVPLFVMNVYDRVLPNQAVETMWVLTLGVTIALAFDFVLKSIRAYFVDFAGRNLDAILSSKIFEKLMRLPLEHQMGSAGNLANRIRSFDMLRDFFSSATVTAFTDIPFAVLFILAIGYLAGFQAACIPLATGTIILLAGLFFHGPLMRYMRANHMESAQKQGFLIESIQRMETIKCLGAEGRMQREWDGIVAASALSGGRERGWASCLTFFSQSMASFTYVAIVVSGVYRIMDGDLSMGGLIACAILGGRAMGPLLLASGLLSKMQQARVALASLNHLMKAPDERPEGRTLLHRPSINGEIECRKVFFRYPTQQGPTVKGVSLKIRPGERVGILGRSGAGKSTLCRLFMGLHMPGNGTLLIDGTDIRQMDPADLRRDIAYMPQDNYLFPGTLRYNIALGGGVADDGEILKALSVTGMEDVAKTHAAGLDRHVGAMADALSQGERQAVCIARTIAKPSSVYILDEPTSQLDNDTEKIFLGRFSNFLNDQSMISTLILVTQRIQPLLLVERLIVLDNGAVVLDGPRDQVLAQMREKAQQAQQAGNREKRAGTI